MNQRWMGFGMAGLLSGAALLACSASDDETQTTAAAATPASPTSPTTQSPAVPTAGESASSSGLASSSSSSSGASSSPGASSSSGARACPVELPSGVGALGGLGALVGDAGDAGGGAGKKACLACMATQCRSELQACAQDCACLTALVACEEKETALACSALRQNANGGPLRRCEAAKCAAACGEGDAG